MGRKERRLMKKFGIAEADDVKRRMKMPTSFDIDGTRVYTIHSDKGKPELYSPEELIGQTHIFSDAEMNRMIYQQVKDLVEAGVIKDWPETDEGIIAWFAKSFATKAMKQVFHEIAEKYLQSEPLLKSGESFLDQPYIALMEQSLDDFIIVRLLTIMVAAARRGSSYSRNYLIALYKVYYRKEYNRLKRLDRLTYLDLLEIFDDDCKANGLPSGHATGSGQTYKEYVEEERRTEAGWMDIYGDRFSIPKEAKGEDDSYNAAANEINAIFQAPVEPPIQPVASRLIIMCEMLGKEVDKTCIPQVMEMNVTTANIARIQFHHEKERIPLERDMVDRIYAWHKQSYPEMTKPELYQKDQRYLALQKAEEMIFHTCRQHGINIRLPFTIRNFELAKEAAEAAFINEKVYETNTVDFNEILYMAEIHHLTACLCDVINKRTDEIDSLLHFSRKKFEEEWEREGDSGKAESSAPTELKDLAKENDGAGKVETAESEKDTNEEIAALRRQLAEKDTALFEAQQKTLLQRALYEESRRENESLNKILEERFSEHAEVIALRSFVHRLEVKENEEREISREEMLAGLKEKKVAVLGGIENWTKKMKTLLPSWSFISVADNSIGADNAMERADFIYIYTNALQHQQYYRAMEIIRRYGKMLYYLGSTNVEENIRKFYRDLCGTIK